MPLKVPDSLPARCILEDEGVEVIRQYDALRQDIRPMRILLLNLMPKKVETEVQLARLLSHTPLQVELTLMTTGSYRPTNTSSEYLATFYKTLETVRHETFDGLVITGAPIEELPFEEVIYWDELCEILDWAERNVFRQFNICWGAQAVLHHRYGVPKHQLSQKLFGIYEQRVLDPRAPLTRGLPDVFPVPVSRHTETRRSDIDKHPQLRILAESEATSLCLVEDRTNGDAFMFNHLEYDKRTLGNEYERDVKAGRTDVKLPYNYFPDDDPTREPANVWRPYGYLLFSNWIGQVYQETPYDLSEIGRARQSVVRGKAAEASG